MKSVQVVARRSGPGFFEFGRVRRVAVTSASGRLPRTAALAVWRGWTTRTGSESVWESTAMTVPVIQVDPLTCALRARSLFYCRTNVLSRNAHQHLYALLAHSRKGTCLSCMRTCKVRTLRSCKAGHIISGYAFFCYNIRPCCSIVIV